MKFFNTTTEIGVIDNNYVVLDNSDYQIGALIITIEIINNSLNATQITFRKIDQNGQLTPYQSIVDVKSGTTILDHIIVINPKQKYCVSSKNDNVIISCSFGR